MLNGPLLGLLAKLTVYAPEVEKVTTSLAPEGGPKGDQLDPVSNDSFAVGPAHVYAVDPAGVTIREAVPLIAPLVAVTVNGPPFVEPAVNNPLLLIVPPPLTVHVTVGLIAPPN